MLDRPAAFGQAVQPHGQHARRHQVAGRGEFLAADDVLVLHAGQVDRRPLAAMDLLDRLVVILQRRARGPSRSPSPWLPVELVADPQPART